MEAARFIERRRNGHPIFLKAGLIALASLWAANGVPPARSDVAVLSQTLNAQLAALGKLSVPSSVTLTPTGTVFSPYTGTLTLRYRVRSTPSGTGATITLRPTGEFSPSGGPTISSGALTYTCSGAALGTPCSGSTTANLGSQTNVVTIPPASCTGGGAPCSAVDPNTVNLNFSLENNPVYETGSYTATVTFTISSI